MNEFHAANVVLGAGAMGSAAAYHLARRGEPVALVEQFALGHDRGSSHGEARIIRYSYANPVYARLMPEAFRAWRDLEADAGETLYLRTGGVSLCPPGVDYAGRVADSLREIGCPHRRMTGREWWKVAPTFQLPDDCDVVFEPDAGMLAAARAVALQVGLARELGGPSTRIFEDCRVQRIDLDADRPTLVTDAGTITADRLIVAAGPWTGRLLPAFADRLRVERQQILYVRPEDPAPFALGRFPAFIYQGESRAYYGMPPTAGRGVKVARHGGDPVDPDADDRAIGEAAIAEVRGFLRGHIPALASAPIEHTEVCKYTVAPGEDFLVGALPGRPEVIVASPCSGHGFKFSCLIGRILADLATTGTTPTDISSWGLGLSS